jgi:hypothetical protein
MKARRGEVEISRQGEEGDKMAIVRRPEWGFWSSLVDLYTQCYGRLAVVSDLDDGGFALNVDKELRGSAVL